MRILILSLLVLITLSVTIKNRRFYDEQGRQIVFHGPNVVVKVPPYLPKTQGPFNKMNSFSQADMANLRRWGFNGIRLGMMWAGVEPTKDTYNQTYLQQMLNLVNKAGKQYGIYTLIDFHQDLIAQKFCGDGIPTWLIDEIHGYRTFPFPLKARSIKLNQSGLPSWQDCNRDGWGTYYFTDDVGKVFNHLYNPRHHLNKKFTAFWRKIAQTFKNNPYVIAYEIINEPFIGDFIRNPILVIPSVAERLKFQQFYDRISHSIRQIDPKTPICVEPVTFDNTVSIGLSHAPGGKQYQNQSVLCYHYYKPPALGPSTMYARIKDAKRLNIASLLSEFAGTNLGNNQIITIAENNLQSWLFWDFKDFGKNWGSTRYQYESFEEGTNSFFDDHGFPIPQILSMLSRTYLQKAAGTVERSYYNHTTKHFNAVYEATPRGKSIVYLNKQMNYNSGYTIAILPKEEVVVVENQNYIQLQYIGSSVKRVMVTIEKI